MTTEVASGPVPVSRVWSGTETVMENVEGDDLGDVLELHDGASAWWVLPRQGEHPSAVLHQAAAKLQLDDLALRDLIAEDRRAKYEELPQSRLVTTNAVTLDREAVELSVRSVSMVATHRALICLVDPLTPGFDPARLLVARTRLLAEGGVEQALQIVVGAVIDSYEAAAEWLEDVGDDLADALFEGAPLSREDQLKAFKVRSAVSRLRRLTDPMSVVMTDLVESQSENPRVARRWLLLKEQHDRVSGAVRALGETLTSVLDTNLALADLRMNQTMKQLTGWAAIIAVPTLITGFAGQNVTFPLDGTVAGFWFYTALMVASAAVLYVLFKRKDWL